MLILIHLYRNTSCSLICIPLCQCIWQNLPLVSHNCLIYSSSDFHRSNMQTGWHVGLFPSTNYPVAATLLHPWMPERRQMSIFSRCILINVRSAAYRCWSQTSIFQHCSQSRCKLSFWDFNKRFLPFDGIIRPVIIDGFGAATRCQIGLSLFGCGEIVAEKKTAQNKKGAVAKKKKYLYDLDSTREYLFIMHNEYTASPIVCYISSSDMLFLPRQQARLNTYSARYKSRGYIVENEFLLCGLRHEMTIT